MVESCPQLQQHRGQRRTGRSVHWRTACLSCDMAVPPAETATYEGLTSELARMRLGEVGRNEITGARAKAPLAIFAGQFASPLIWVLFGASVVSALLHEWIDAIA